MAKGNVMRLATAWCSCLAFILLSGCGSQEQLRGRVTFEDGSPLELGTVCFLREGYLARGIIQPDGSYVVGSEAASDGLPAGTYQVYIDGAAVEDPTAPGGMAWKIDEKLTHPDTSELTVTVPVPGGRFDLTVSPPE